MKRFKNILCVVEYQKDNNAVVEQAVRLAENNQAKLTVMSVVPPMVNYNGLLENDAIANELDDSVIDRQNKN